MPSRPEYIGLFIAAMGALLLAPTGAAMASGTKVAGLDFCADQFVLAFADRKDIVAVSEDAVGPHSFYRARADGLPTVRGGGEEILTLRPDIVMRSWRGSLAMDSLFARVGIAAFQPPYAFDYDATLGNFQLAADRLGKPERGQAFVADLRARHQALQAMPPISMKAVYMTPSGFTAGGGTSVDTIIRLAGFDTIAADIGLQGWGELPLERLVMTPPDVVIGSFFEEGAVHVSNWSSGRHGVFRGLVRDLPTIMVPSSLMSCGGAFSVQAAEYIREQARGLGLIDSNLVDGKGIQTETMAAGASE